MIQPIMGTSYYGNCLKAKKFWINVRHKWEWRPILLDLNPTILSVKYTIFYTSSIGKQLHNSALGIINNLHSNIKIWHLPTCFLVLKKGIMKYLYKKIQWSM